MIFFPAIGIVASLTRTTFWPCRVRFGYFHHASFDLRTLARNTDFFAYLYGGRHVTRLIGKHAAKRLLLVRLGFTASSSRVLPGMQFYY